MSYKGRYTLKHPEKYIGDAKKIVYRSLWERQAFKWCENNPKVKAWNSEEIVEPYKSSVDKKLHRYFVDLLIQMEDKSTYLVEIKPKKETINVKDRPPQALVSTHSKPKDPPDIKKYIIKKAIIGYAIA